MTKTIPWDSGGGNITITYEEGNGNQSISVVSDANSGEERSKTITITAGTESKTLTINQEMKPLQNGSFVGIPSGYDKDLSVFASISSYYPINNAYDNTSSNLDSTINCRSGSGARSAVYLTFDVSSIPSNAIIKSVKCKIKAKVSNTNRAKSAKARLIKKPDFNKGNSVSFLTTTATVFTIDDGGIWNRDELNALTLCAQVNRSSTQVNSMLTMNIYGAELMIDYEY